MALDFSDPLKQIFEVLGQEAVYVPEVGEQKTIIVLPSEADAITRFERSAAQSSTLTLEVLTADVAEFTKDKDKIIFKGSTYVVQSSRIKDSLKLVWYVDTYMDDGE